MKNYQTEKFVINFTIISLLFLTAGCISSYNNNENVLSKSSIDTPEWVKKNTNNSNESDLINVVYKRTNVYNLSLGIKQAQAAAILHTPSLVLQEVKKTLLANIQNNSFNELNIKKDSLKGELLSIANKNKFAINYKPALPQDVYWEYRQRDTDNGLERYYTIWILLSIPKSDYEKVLKTVALDLTRSSFADAVSLGHTILNKKKNSP